MTVGAINKAEPKTKTSNLNWNLAGLNAGISAAAGGIIGASVVAPLKVKSLEALYNNEDIFTSTLAKIDNKSPDLAQSVKANLTLLKNNEGERIKICNKIFPNEIIAPSEYMTFVQDQKSKLTMLDSILENLYSELSGLKGKEITLGELIEIGRKYAVNESVNGNYSNNFLNKKITVDDKLIKIWTKASEQNVEALQKSLEITQSGISLEKEGKILKSELLEYFKKSFKDADKSFLNFEEKASFNAIKQYLPKNRLKGALIVGGIAAIFSGLVGLFTPKKEK